MAAAAHSWLNTVWNIPCQLIEVLHYLNAAFRPLRPLDIQGGLIEGQRYASLALNLVEGPVLSPVEGWNIQDGIMEGQRVVSPARSNDEGPAPCFVERNPMPP